MKWTYVIPQKIKTAALLLGIMALGILLNLIERNNIAHLNRSVSSIYNDRLIPATDVFYMTENLYEKRFAMEKFLATKSNDTSRLKAELSSHDRNIANLVHRFEQTYLVDAESVFLASFKEQARRYSRIEAQVLAMSEGNRKADGRAFYETQGEASLQKTIRQLAELTKVQTTVGSQLLDDSKSVLAISKLVSSLQIILTLVIGFMINSLVTAAKIMNPKKQNSHLN